MDLVQTDLTDHFAVLLNQSVATVRFGPDTTTLRWPRLLGVVSFNVYRGDLSDLVDLDQDGLPDPVYGACRNDHDPDTTDTVFVDDETPTSGQGRPQGHLPGLGENLARHRVAQ